jgi:Dna[CI] antecedent, DciA
LPLAEKMSNVKVGFFYTSSKNRKIVNQFSIVKDKFESFTRNEVALSKTRNHQTPRNYNGTAVTTHHITDLLSHVLSQISDVYQDRPDLLIACWPEIIGPQLAGMTQAVSFINGVLTVKVKNSTLHSLLSRHDKFRILSVIQQKFPKIEIENIFFKIA